MTRAKSKPIATSQESLSARRAPSRSGQPSTPKANGSAKTAAPVRSTAGTAKAAAKPAPKASKSKVPAKAKPAPAKPLAAKAEVELAGKAVAVKKATVKALAAAKSSTARAATSKLGALKAAPAGLDTPAKLRPIEQAVGVSSDAVARRTGKSWAQWFALLDAAGAADLDHKGIVAVLAQRHGVGPWWQQMVTVAYEQARGKNGTQTADDGFQVGVVKVLELPLAKLYRFWSEPAERNKWLADDRFSIHKATASKSIRARWGRGVSRIDVDFCEKGPTQSQVTVQHNRIETSDAAEQMKAYWAKKISALEALLTRP
jgi:hypothetical protein